MIEHDPFVLRRILALRKFPMFANAELGDLALLAENLAEASYPKGSVIALAGARPPALHLVLDGEIASIPRAGRSPSRSTSGTGRETWGPLDVFGALEVLARRELAAPAVAARETRTLQLFSTDLTEVLEESFGVLRATLRVLAARVWQTAPPVLHADGDVPASDPLGLVDRLILLRRQPPFAGARLDAVAMLSHASDEVRFAAGDTIVRAGEAATTAYVVVEGSLRATDERGVEHALGPGDAIGALETLAELPHAETIDALTPVRALASGATAIFDVLEDHTDLGLAMIASFARELADQPRRRATSTGHGA